MNFGETGLIGTTSTSHTHSCVYKVNSATKTTTCYSFDATTASIIYLTYASPFTKGLTAQLEVHIIYSL